MKMTTETLAAVATIKVLVALAVDVDALADPSLAVVVVLAVA